MIRRIATALLFATTAIAFAHPHFPKKVEFALGFEADSPKLAVSHLTVTFDKAGFAAAKVGDTWHFANGHLSVPLDLKIGGKDVKKGEYRLLARKAADDEWELVLDPGGEPFRRELSKDAFALDTTFTAKQPVQEHLRLDLQPSGDKEHTSIKLEAHFDQYLATAKIELPAAQAKK